MARSIISLLVVLTGSFLCFSQPKITGTLLDQDGKQGPPDFVEDRLDHLTAGQIDDVVDAVATADQAQRLEESLV